MDVYMIVLAVAVVLACAVAGAVLVPRVLRSWDAIIEPADKDIEWASHMKGPDEVAPLGACVDEREPGERAGYPGRPVPIIKQA